MLPGTGQHVTDTSNMFSSAHVARQQVARSDNMLPVSRQHNIHLCHGRLVSFCIQQQTGNNCKVCYRVFLTRNQTSYFTATSEMVMVVMLTVFGCIKYAYDLFYPSFTDLVSAGIFFQTMVII